MPTATESMVEIPAFKKEGKAIIPAFRISSDIGRWGERALDVYKKAPTLLQLRYADSVNPAISKNIRHLKYSEESTADFGDYNVRAPKGRVVPKGFLYVKWVQRPDRVWYDEDKGIWLYKGGNVVGVELPPDGWQVPYEGRLWHPETSSPLLTVEDKEEAINELSKLMPREQAEKEASLFWRWEKNHERLSPVSRYYWNDEYGPWSVYASWYSPLDSDPSLGFRVVRRI